MCGPDRGCSGRSSSWAIAPSLPAWAVGSASTKIRPGASARPSAAAASGGVPGAAVPGSRVQAVMRTEPNEPRSTMSHPDTVRPSSTSVASPPPVKTHGTCSGCGPEHRAHVRSRPDQHRPDRRGARADVGQGCVGGRFRGIRVTDRDDARRSGQSRIEALSSGHHRFRAGAGRGRAEQAAVVRPGADHRREPVVVINRERRRRGAVSGGRDEPAELRPDRRELPAHPEPVPGRDHRIRVRRPAGGGGDAPRSAMAVSRDLVSGPGTCHSCAGVQDPEKPLAGGGGWGRNSGISRPVGSNTYWPGHPATATGVPARIGKLDSRHRNTRSLGIPKWPTAPRPARTSAE